MNKFKTFSKNYTMMVSIVLRSILGIVLLLPYKAVAGTPLNDPGGKSYNDPTGLEGAVKSTAALVEKAINTALLSTSPYGAFIKSLFVGVVIIYILFAIFGYILDKIDLNGLAERVIYAVMVIVLFLSYNTMTQWVFEGLNGLSDLWQATLLGDPATLGPVAFFHKLIANFNFVDFNIFADMKSIISYILLRLLMALFEIVLFVIALITTFSYLIAKSVGLLFIMTLLIKPISYLFDGWLKWLLSISIYSFMARFVVVMLVKLAELLFGVVYHIGGTITGLAPKASAYDLPSDISDIINLVLFFAVGLFFLVFGCAEATRQITGGGTAFGVSNGLRTVSGAKKFFK
jgi:hypothetical protein